MKPLSKTLRCTTYPEWRKDIRLRSALTLSSEPNAKSCRAGKPQAFESSGDRLARNVEAQKRKASTMNQIAITQPGAVAEFSSGPKVANAIELWLAGLSSEGTRKAYLWELQQFAAFAGHGDVTAAMVHFLKLTDGQAHAAADAWRAAKIASGRSPASVNRSMATLNSFVALAKRHGLTALSLRAKAEKSQRYRDTCGCGIHGVQKLLSEEHEQHNAKAARDVAILRLAFGLGLRRNEPASLDICHVDLAGEKLLVLGKGSRERIALTLPRNAKEALTAWLQWRGTDAPDAPLFINLAHNSPGNRISGAATMTSSAISSASVPTWSHAPMGFGMRPLQPRSTLSPVTTARQEPSAVILRWKQSAAMTTIVPIMLGRLPLWWTASLPKSLSAKLR